MPGPGEAFFFRFFRIYVLIFLLSLVFIFCRMFFSLDLCFFSVAFYFLSIPCCFCVLCLCSEPGRARWKVRRHLFKG